MTFRVTMYKNCIIIALLGYATTSFQASFTIGSEVICEISGIKRFWKTVRVHFFPL